jgi:DNA-binding transcriptional LysR family regulator
MLDVRRLRLLRELSLRGTIAAVAGALAYTPSAVSQQLSALEREVGLPLLERTGRRVALTPAAHALVRHTEAVLHRLEQATAELAEARHGLAGPVRIGTFPTAGRSMIPAALAALAGCHPGLEPMVFELDPALVANALRAGEVDVALVHRYDFVPEAPEPGVATEPLCVEAMYLATARDDRLAAATGDGAGDGIAGRRDAPWITATPGTMCHTMTVRACQAAGFRPRVRHQIDEFDTVLALVAAGQGVALVPRLAVAEPRAGVRLTALPLHRQTRIAYRSGAGGHPAVRAFADALRRSVPPDLVPAEPSGDLGVPLPP